MTLNEEIVLGCAFRYALGRMTYVVDSVASEIERLVNVLPIRDLNRYIREIDEAVTESRTGMDMDTRRWQTCRAALAAELERRAQ